MNTHVAPPTALMLITTVFLLDLHYNCNKTLSLNIYIFVQKFYCVTSPTAIVI